MGYNGTRQMQPSVTIRSEPPDSPFGPYRDDPLSPRFELRLDAAGGP